MNTEPNPLDMRDCPSCKRAVNNYEWRLCKRVDCPCAHDELRPVGVRPSSGIDTSHISLPQRRAYVALKGMVCPFCKIDEVVPLGDFDPVEETKVTRHVQCVNGHTWVDVYTLTSIVTPAQHEALWPMPAEEAAPSQPSAQ